MFFEWWYKVWKAAFKKTYVSVYFFKVMVNSDSFGRGNEQQCKWLKTRNRNTRQKCWWTSISPETDPPHTEISWFSLLPITASCCNVAILRTCGQSHRSAKILQKGIGILPCQIGCWPNHPGIKDQFDRGRKPNNPTIGDWIINSTLGREYQSRNHHLFQVSLILPVTHRYQEHAKCSFHFQALNITELRMYICFCPNLLAYISIICSQKARFFGPLASQSESFSSGTMLRLPLSSMTLSNGRDRPWSFIAGHGRGSLLCEIIYRCTKVPPWGVAPPRPWTAVRPCGVSLAGNGGDDGLSLEDLEDPGTAKWWKQLQFWQSNNMLLMSMVVVFRWLVLQVHVGVTLPVLRIICIFLLFCTLGKRVEKFAEKQLTMLLVFFVLVSKDVDDLLYHPKPARTSYPWVFWPTPTDLPNERKSTTMLSWHHTRWYKRLDGACFKWWPFPKTGCHLRFIRRYSTWPLSLVQHSPQCHDSQAPGTQEKNMMLKTSPWFHVDVLTYYI